MAGNIEVMNFDEILKQVGHFGRYQKLRILLLMIGPLCGGIAVTSFIFTAYVPKYRCVVNECETVNTASYYEREVLPFHDAEDMHLNFSKFVELGIGLIDPSSSIDDIGKTCKKINPSKLESGPPTIEMNATATCEALQNKISGHNILRNTSNMKNVQNLTESCSLDDLVFDKSVVTSSFSIDHQFVCDRYYWKGIFNALYMVGMLVGAFILGIIADHWGRRSAFFLAVLLVSTSGVIAPFVSSTFFFGILRIIEGMGGMGCFLIPYVMIAESTLPTHVVTLTVFVGMGWPTGEMILALEAYLIRDHFTLQLVSHAPMFLVILVIYFFIPESTRWLISKKMYETASKQVLKIAETNNTSPPTNISYYQKESGKIELSPTVTKNELKDSNNSHTVQHPDKSKLTIADLFRPLPIMLRTFNLFLQWFSVTMTFYGLTFASATLELTGNVYMNFTLNVLVEFVASLTGWLLIDKLGRRPFMIGTQLVSGICVLICGSMVSIPENSYIRDQVNVPAIQTFFYLFGKLLAGLCFGMCYLYTSELYPTSLRGTAVGSCSTMARVGGIIALVIAPLKRIWKPLPMTILGSVAVIAGLFAIAFPETTGEKMPETMEEALNIGKKQKRITYNKENGIDNEAYK